MELKEEEVCEGLSCLSTKYPWFVVQDLQDLSLQTFSTLDNPLMPHYRCRIPELVGQRIQGCFHGWLVLSNHPRNDVWSLWNPSSSTCNIVSLPPLVLKDGDGDSIRECCLSAPPDNPTSVLLLTRTNKSTFVFCHLSPKRKKKLRWMEMSFAYQLKRISWNGRILHSLTCCNGKVYALNTDSHLSETVIQIEIVIKDSEVVITLLLFGAPPMNCGLRSSAWTEFLKGSCTELFHITVGFAEQNKKTVSDVFFHKLDMTRINWEELKCLKKWDTTGWIIEELEAEAYEDLNITGALWQEMQDLKDAILFVDLARDCSVCYNPAIEAKLGGYIHMRDVMGKIMHSYHVKDRTISLSSMPSPVLPTSHVLVWECRQLEDDLSEAKCTFDSKQVENEIMVISVNKDSEVQNNECHLLNIPFDVLKMIMEFCVGVEYMNFRATCKHCHQAAPLIQWSNKSASTRLRNYSLASPWLMVLDENRGVITFTDPMLGDNYFIKNSSISFVDDKHYCSRFGWLLLKSYDFDCLVFFNPFTNDLRKLPESDYFLDSCCFSAPPTSPNCIVVGFTNKKEGKALINLVDREPLWRVVHLGVDQLPATIRFPTLYGQDLCALCDGGELIAFKGLLGQEDYSCKIVKLGEAPRISSSAHEYFLMEFDRNPLLVIVGKYGEVVELFKWNDSTNNWEEIDGVGKHMIYICGTTCICMEAKMPEMENKIYFPRHHSENEKIVCYSLETRTYHTFNGKTIGKIFEDFFGTKHHLNYYTWIEPSWC